MAYLVNAGYDYDGVLYAFGVVVGLSNVAKVRMTLYAENFGTYYYESTMVYDQTVGKINTSYVGGTPAFVYNIRTDWHAMDGAPTKLNYWIATDNLYGCYQTGFQFYNASGTLLNSTPLYPTDAGSNTRYQMHNSLTAPTATWNASNKTVSVNSVPGYRVFCEIRRKNRTLVNNTINEFTKDYISSVLMKGFEAGKKWEGTPHTYFEDDGFPVRARYLYPYGTCPVVVLFDSGANFNQSVQDTYTGYIQEACNQIRSICNNRMNFSVTSIVNTKYTNSSIEDSGQMLVDNYGDDYILLVRIGNQSSMGNLLGGQGLWQIWAWGGYPEWGIANGTANINVTQSANNESIKHVIFEEFYQSFGIGDDNYEVPLSIHWDPEYTNPDNYTTDAGSGIAYDAEVMKFAQSEDMNGWNVYDFLNSKDLPCILYQDSGGTKTFDLSPLVGGDFWVDVWIAGEKSNPGGGGTSFNWYHGGWDDSSYSPKTRISVTTAVRPAPFAWDTAKTQGQPFKLTAVEWNRLQQNIRDMWSYKQITYPGVTLTDVAKGDIVTAVACNNVIAGIKALGNGAGGYLYNVNPGGDITAYLLNLIVSELNVVG